VQSDVQVAQNPADRALVKRLADAGGSDDREDDVLPRRAGRDGGVQRAGLLVRDRIEGDDQPDTSAQSGPRTKSGPLGMSRSQSVGDLLQRRGQRGALIARGAHHIDVM